MLGFESFFLNHDFIDVNESSAAFDVYTIFIRILNIMLPSDIN